MTTKTHLMTTISLNQLRIDDKSNVRKIGRGADPAFMASIATRHKAGKSGLIQPLIVRPNGSGHVVMDGGQRLAAMQALAKDGTLPTDYPVPCVVENASDAEARENSLTSNVVRTDMHPVDEFRAFNDLHTDKTRALSVDEIAARYGIGKKHVEQRLALGALDPVILDAWRDGKIDADAAKAFTLCVSRKQQVTVFTQLGKRGDLQHWMIRRAIGGNDRNVGKYLAFVGIAAYEKRGGKVTQDLFGGSHVVSNPDLLTKMVQEKIKETAEKLTAGGWAFVLTERPNNYYDFGTLRVELKPSKEEKAKLDALRKEIAQLEKNEDEETDREQEARIELAALEQQIGQHSYTPEQRAKVGCFVFLDHDGDLEIEYGRTKPTTRTVQGPGGTTKKVKVKVKGVPKISQALGGRLLQQRMHGIKTALLTHPHANDFARLLAGIVAAQINDKTANDYYVAPAEVKPKLGAIIEAISPKVLNAAMLKSFDAKDYFESCGKAFCLAAIAEAVNADEARKLQGKKGAEIAKAAIANVTEKTKWLPKELRTSHYDGPVAKATTKAKPKSKSAAKRNTKAKSKAKRK